MGAMSDTRHCVSTPIDPDFATPGVMDSPPGVLHFAPPSFYAPCGGHGSKKDQKGVIQALKHVLLYNIPHSSHDLIASTRDVLVILILCFPIIFRYVH